MCILGSDILPRNFRGFILANTLSSTCFLLKPEREIKWVLFLSLSNQTSVLAESKQEHLF